MLVFRVVRKVAYTSEAGELREERFVNSFHQLFKGRGPSPFVNTCLPPPGHEEVPVPVGCTLIKGL